MVGNEYHRQFIKELGCISNSYSQVDVFTDVCRAMQLALLKPTLLDAKRAADVEDEYMRFPNKYGAENWQHAAKCMEITTDALQERRECFLGHILEEIGASNKNNGQFLTPIPVANMCADITMDADLIKDYKPGKVISIYDNAGGAGVMLIAGAEALLKRGVRQSDIMVVHGDIDSRACSIAYVQFTLLGYAAVVCHQDGLTLQEYEKPAYTIGFYLHNFPLRGYLHGWTNSRVASMKNADCEKHKEEAKQADAPIEINVGKTAQMEFAL